MDSLSPQALSEMKNQVKTAMDELLRSEEQALSDLLIKKSSLEAEKNELYEQEKKLDSNEKYPIFHKRQELNTVIRSLETPIRNQQNVVLALKNGGTLNELSDKKGNTFTKVPSFLDVKTNVISFDIETILTTTPAAYIPVIDESVFKSKGYIFDSLRISKDTYLLATNGYHYKTKVDTAGINGFVLVTLDQLALISDYYYLKAKALLQKDADDANKRREEQWDRMPEEKRKNWLENTSAASLYASMPQAKRKLITLEEWKLLTWQEKEKIHKFVGRSGPKKMVSKLDDQHMWVSYHSMYEAFINPEAVQAGGYANKEAFNYWRHFREMLDWKIKDIQVERETDSQGRKIALETSFGDSNIVDDLRDYDGLFVKRQDGSEIKPVEVNQISDSFRAVEKIFGPLSFHASEYGLKISHTGSKYVFASKAAGMFVPDMKAIAVSNKFGEVQFTQIFAHELAHWIDSLLGGNGRYASGNYESTAGQIAYTVKKGMNKTGDSKYINASVECFARAFEQYFAVETHGEDARLQYSHVALQGNIPYFIQDNYVPKPLYDSTLKPLIEQFLKENKDWFKSISVSDSVKTMAAIMSTVEPIAEIKKDMKKIDLQERLNNLTEKEKAGKIVIINKGGFIGDPITFFRDGKIYKGKTKYVREVIKARGGEKPTQAEISEAVARLKNSGVDDNNLFNLKSTTHYGNWVVEGDLVISPKKVSLKDAEFELNILAEVSEDMKKETPKSGMDQIHEIIKKAKTKEEAFDKVSKVKTIAIEDANAFRDKYDPEKKLSSREAFYLMYNDVKGISEDKTGKFKIWNELGMLTDYGISEAADHKFGSTSDLTIAEYYGENFLKLKDFHIKNLRAKYLSEMKKGYSDFENYIFAVTLKEAKEMSADDMLSYLDESREGRSGGDITEEYLKVRRRHFKRPSYFPVDKYLKELMELHNIKELKPYTEMTQEKLSKSNEFNKIIRSIKPADLQFFEVLVFDGGRPINLYFEEKDGNYIPMFGYNEGNFAATSAMGIKPLTAKQEEDLYAQVEKGLVQLEKVPTTKYANAGMKREVLISIDPVTKRPTLDEVKITAKEIGANKKMIIFKWRNNYFKYTSSTNSANGFVTTHIEKYDLKDKRFNQETGLPGMGANSEMIYNSLNSDMITGEGELINKAIQGWDIVVAEKKNLKYKFPDYNPPVNLESYAAPVAFTSVYPLVDTHLYHSEHGYRLPAELVFSDGKIEVKLKEGKKDISVSVREIHPDGYRGVDNIEKKTSHLDLQTFDNETDLNNYLLTIKDKFKDVYMSLNEVITDAMVGTSGVITVDLPLWKKEVTGYKKIKDAIPHVNAIEGALDNGMYEKAVAAKEMTALQAAAIIDSAGWIVPESIQVQAYKQVPTPDQNAESFSDCLKRNGINLEKDRHKFQIGTIIKENESGVKYKVVDFGVNNFIMSSFSLFSKETKTVEVPYDMVIDHFVEKSISIDGFHEEEIMEFARVINTIEHCKKMDLLEMENGKLKIKNENKLIDNLSDQVSKMEDYEIDAKMKSLLKEKEAGNWDDNTHRTYMYLASEKNRRDSQKLESALHEIIDINGVQIKPGDKVKTQQPGGGVFNPADAEIGIAEDATDAFGNKTLQIRFNKGGSDRFILLYGKINEVIKDEPESKFNIGDKVYYIPPISGFDNFKPLTINHKAYKPADEWQRGGWSYGFKEESYMSSIESDLSSKKPVYEKGSKETIDALKLLLSLEKDAKKKKEISYEIKRLS